MGKSRGSVLFSAEYAWDESTPRNGHLTRVELIDPILHDLGWTGAMIREKKTPSGSDILDGLAPKWRHERDAAFTYKNKHWLKDFQERTSAVAVNMARHFERNGIEELETPKLFEVQGVDFNALSGLPVEPSALIQETMVRWMA